MDGRQAGRQTDAESLNGGARRWFCCHIIYTSSLVRHEYALDDCCQGTQFTMYASTANIELEGAHESWQLVLVADRHQSLPARSLLRKRERATVYQRWEAVRQLKASHEARCTLLCVKPCCRVLLYSA